MKWRNGLTDRLDFSRESADKQANTQTDRRTDGRYQLHYLPALRSIKFNMVVTCVISCHAVNSLMMQCSKMGWLNMLECNKSLTDPPEYSQIYRCQNVFITRVHVLIDIKSLWCWPKCLVNYIMVREGGLWSSFLRDLTFIAGRPGRVENGGCMKKKLWNRRGVSEKKFTTWSGVIKKEFEKQWGMGVYEKFSFCGGGCLKYLTLGRGCAKKFWYFDNFDPPPSRQ